MILPGIKSSVLAGAVLLIWTRYDVNCFCVYVWTDERITVLCSVGAKY